MSRDLCIMARTFCRDPIFQQWAHTQCGACQTADEAKKFILEACAIESRNELDVNHAAAQRFHKLIREPFLAWKAQP
jgi:hypothetical protein